MEKKTELSAEEKERRKRILKEKLPSGPPRKSLRKMNVDPETLLNNEPIHYFSNKTYSKSTEKGDFGAYQYNTGDHHIVFEDYPPRLPVEVHLNKSKFIHKVALIELHSSTDGRTDNLTSAVIESHCND